MLVGLGPYLLEALALTNARKSFDRLVSLAAKRRIPKAEHFDYARALYNLASAQRKLASHYKLAMYEFAAPYAAATWQVFANAIWELCNFRGRPYPKRGYVDGWIARTLTHAKQTPDLFTYLAELHIRRGDHATARAMLDRALRAGYPKKKLEALKRDKDFKVLWR
jgi:hypothetical protein